MQLNLVLSPDVSPVCLDEVDQETFDAVVLFGGLFQVLKVTQKNLEELVLE